jgi:hypothetical protein
MEAVVKSLDPNSTGNREMVLDAATDIISYVVKTYVPCGRRVQLKIELTTFFLFQDIRLYVSTRIPNGLLSVPTRERS